MLVFSNVFATIFANVFDQRFDTYFDEKCCKNYLKTKTFQNSQVLLCKFQVRQMPFFVGENLGSKHVKLLQFLDSLLNSLQVH